jgi:hypothetical protein
MPNNYALRTPLFAKGQSSGASTQSAKLLVIVNGVTVYTIIKPALPNVNVIFEVAELLKDYLGTTYTYAPQKIAFTTNIQFFNQPNAGGSAQGSPVQALIGDGYDAYSIYTDGANSKIPFKNRQSQNTWLLEVATPNTSATNDDFYIFVPNNTDGKVPSISSSGVVSTRSYSVNDTAILVSGYPRVNIIRIDCTKYGDGHKISFINRYGILQDLWFFLKKVDSIGRSNESYNRNTLEDDATYDIIEAPKRLFNTTVKQSRTLSSGYYPEWANAYFEQLLLSEHVWLTTPQTNSSTYNDVIPVVVKTSSMTFKTSVNDRLIDYTIEFEDAFDYINNIR